VSIIGATMRLQFHSGFSFDDATAIVPYLADLGVTHLYASPIMTARAGSLHGYDVVDPTRINPELGGEAAFRNLVGALRQAGLGIIVDIVPNHMAVGGNDNPWWLDVLQNGRESRFAAFFDIDWEADDPLIRGKVLAPVLGRPYHGALQNGEITLAFNESHQRYEARYFHHSFPIAPADRQEIERHPIEAYDPTTEAGHARLHQLLERQNFRLAWWRIANDAINWRRFFDINELAALRMEEEDVFETTHAKLFELFAAGLIDGVRIDHVDGLADPGGYCRRLRARLEALVPARPEECPHDPPYIIVEKILGTGEQLPADWACDGTSGYDFMDQVSRVLHAPDGQASLADLWSRVSGRPAAFAEEEQASRREILCRSFAAQLDALTRAFLALAQSSLATRDMTGPATGRALIEILSHMNVYRTYATVGCASSSDMEKLHKAVEAALGTCLRADRASVLQLAIWLDGKGPGNREQQLIAMRKFQQLSAPLAAKAVEDTAFYRYAALLSRLDVGFDPARFSDGILGFHRQMAERAAAFPHAMLASATHDHKRGEDVRARLAVLSEIPEEWATALAGWFEQAEPLFKMVDNKRAPTRGDAAILFQMIVGAWPLELGPADEINCAAFAERLAAWQLKALREAKLATEWTVPDEAYEAVAHNFLMGLFTPEWRERISSFVTRIAAAGALNGLTQTLLKLTVPGVPDFFQGTEFWDFSLVDPDNRRAVDFSARQKALSAERPMTDLAVDWKDGRIKQALITTALRARHAAPALFAEGDYLPLEAIGPGADHIIAFMRRRADTTALVVAPRLSMTWLESDRIAFPPGRWADTAIKLPDGFEPANLRDVFSARQLRVASTQLPIAELLEYLPVALLLSF
jgi:(1->4)-alpha-D-glucan 1-alpha-D-glucosylmutase